MGYTRSISSDLGFQPFKITRHWAPAAQAKADFGSKVRRSGQIQTILASGRSHASRSTLLRLKMQFMVFCWTPLHPLEVWGAEGSYYDCSRISHRPNYISYVWLLHRPDGNFWWLYWPEYDMWEMQPPDCACKQRCVSQLCARVVLHSCYAAACHSEIVLQAVLRRVLQAWVDKKSIPIHMKSLGAVHAVCQSS